MAQLSLYVHKSGIKPDLFIFILRRFLHNHGNIAIEGSPKSGLSPTRKVWAKILYIIEQDLVEY